MASNHTITPATGTLTFTGNAANTETVVVGGKTYTFKSTLTATDGGVKVGANAAASAQNLYDAINLSGTSGTQYATGMTANTRVRATAVTATTVVVTALTAGEVGNLIASTDTVANAAWGAATLASGAGNLDSFITGILQLNQVNAEVLSELKKLTLAVD